MISALNTLWIEDPSLSFSINSYSDELEISLYGLTQKEIIQTLLEERFSVKVHFDEIKTIYKERPIKKVIENGVGDHQQSRRLQLLAKAVNIEYDDALVEIDGAFVTENIQ